MHLLKRIVVAGLYAERARKALRKIEVSTYSVVYDLLASLGLGGDYDFFFSGLAWSSGCCRH
jgi:hypothetical protein